MKEITNITDKTPNTKKLRLKIYKEALLVLTNNNYGGMTIGFCNTIYIAIFNINDKVPRKFDSYYSLKIKYPELAKYEPKEHRMCWFPTNEKGKAKRIKILQTIIKEMENDKL